jgi:hypothetical protein
VWITRTIPDSWRSPEDEVDTLTPQAEIMQALKLRHGATPLTAEERLKVCRLHNAIIALAKFHLNIAPDTIMSVYQKSVDLKMEPKVRLT